MSMKETFIKLVEDIFSDRTGDLNNEVNRIMEEMRVNLQIDAEKVFNEKTGAELDSYLEFMRNRDYRSEIARRLTGQKITPLEQPSERSKVTLEYVQQVVPQLLQEYGYVTAMMVSPESPRTAGYLLSHFSDRLGLAKETKKGEIRFVVKAEAISEILSDYKPNMGYDRTWNKFMELTKDGENGVTSREILQAIVYEEQGRVSDKDMNELARRYSPILGMVLGRLRVSGKPIEKTDGKWIIKRYEESLMQEDVDYIITHTLEVSEKVEEGIGRWKASDVWPDHPDKVERFYEQRLNGGTVRDREGIGMELIPNPRTGKVTAVYFWRGGKGDFSQTKQTVYRILAGHPVASSEEERQIRETFGDTTGRY